MTASTDVPRATVAPPRGLMIGAGAAVLVGALLLAAPPSVPVQVVGYLMSSFVSILLLAAFRWVDVGRRHEAGYRSEAWLRRAGPLIAAAGVVVAAIHVWRLATELAG